jgi:glycerol-3-phosphate dehydrogenase
MVPIKCADGTRVIPYQAPTRQEQIMRLKQTEEFDVLVIGGGATGAGVALDAATRGLRVALVERDDFGAGTSGRSTKLIHGGIRYLQNAFLNLDYKEYELVKEALQERKHMLTCAPYMNKPLPIMIPLYRRNWYDVFKVPYYYIGARVYDLVGGRDSGVPESSFISKEEAIYQFPMIEDKHLMGAIVYYGTFSVDFYHRVSPSLKGSLIFY